MDFLVDDDNRSQGTASQTSHSLEAELPVERCFTMAQVLISVHDLDEILAASDMASGPQADLDVVFPGGRNLNCV